MKARKILSVSGIVLILIIGAAWIFLGSIKNRALPDYNKDLVLSGIKGKVEVLRDSFAIPHIYAENEEDLYTAVGFVMAQDRLWQMDLLRRVTTGRLSEIFGADMADADQLLRALRMSEKSKRIYEQTEPDLKSALESFCSGVNQFINQAGKKLPPEFLLLGYTPEPWEPYHSINLIGYMAWDLSTGWTTEVLLDQLRLRVGDSLALGFIPELSRQNSYVYPDFSITPDEAAELSSLSRITSTIDQLGLDVFRGSNNWAVSGEKSTTGSPILANDMHLGLMIPGIWYQMHHTVPGKLNVSGVVLPGQPMVVAGHNDQIAWGFTNVMVDDIDFFSETVNPANPEEYRFNGEWVKMESREEKILTSKGDTIIRTNKFTHRGPVISGMKKIENKVISMRWLGNEESNELRSVYLLNRAQNWDQFREALETFVSVNQNAVYADRMGNIGLQSTIGIPLRKESGVRVFPGETDEFDWQGLVPFNELPKAYNPPSGFVSSANNRTANPEYPHYISAWYDLPYRKDRIDQLLTAKTKLGIEDFKAIQADRKSLMAAKFLPFFLQNCQVTDKPELNEILNLLKSWDYELTRESQAATLFEFWYYQIFVNLISDEAGDLFESLNAERTLVKNFMENLLAGAASGWIDNQSTSDKVETLGDIVTESLNETITLLTERYGSDRESWAWGEVHSLTIRHPMAKVSLLNRIFGLSRGPYPAGGSFHTVGPYSYPFGNPEEVNHGASHRHIFSLGDPDDSQTIIPTGTSGIPSSPFYCDQTELYMANRYHSDYLSKVKVEQQARFRMVISGK